MSSANYPTDRDVGARITYYLAVGFTLTAGFAIVYALLAVPSDRMTSHVVALLTALVWPYLVLFTIILFRPQAEKLLSVIANRINDGSEFVLGSLIKISELAKRIPAPSSKQNVTLENIALLHTSFFSPAKTKEFNDGLKYYQFEVIIIAPEIVMHRIKSVTYHLEDSWPEKFRTREVIDRSSRFRMKDLANGTSIVRADVRFWEQEELLQLNRFIDLRPDGPKI